ncbi:DUF4199 domain-containing protein [Dinghuibacter silviterrae]|uniref:Uncharacterized protein DUF4199 n=1 Tax=Dinghuibacter silviterrae TaxID=1539049 RepID=A0A4R8DF75_9BACT|nr:DUF4199 domain-containing protein [Dinghuibacter silviterrae]TDW96229.1 uncharacterized protein DUF4199 [Dinghuibacter silviterrae]
MRKSILVFGLISGLLVGVLSNITIWMHTENVWLGYAVMVVAFAFIYVGVRNYRDRFNDGRLTFAQGLKVGLGISLIGATLYVLFWLVDFYVFMPDFMDKYSAHILEEAKKSGVSAEALARKTAELDNMKDMYKSPVWVILMTYMEVLPVTIVISLLSALLLRRRRNPPLQTASSML